MTVLLILLFQAVAVLTAVATLRAANRLRGRRA